MRDRIKWMLVGLGITFGLQVLISLIFTGIAYSVAASETSASQGTISLIVFGITLGTFLVGGFVIGWTSEDLRIGDGILVAALTILLSGLVYLALPDDNKGQFVTGLLLSDAAGQFSFLQARSIVFTLVALVSGAVGAYLGWHVHVPQEGVFDRVALVVGLLGAVVGPFVLLAIGGGRPGSDEPNLPWYFLVIVLLVLLVIIGIGFVMFTRESHEAEEISISPETRREH